MENLIKSLIKSSESFKDAKRTMRVNAGAFDYKYAPMEEVLNATRDALRKNGLTVIQHVIGENGQLGIETVIAHESGETMSSKFLASPVKNDPQSIGSFITYMRRYAYMSVLGLAPEDDDAQSAMPDPKDYIIPIGKKYKGQKLSDVPRDDLISFVEWLEKQGEPKGLSKEFISMADKFLNMD